MDKPERFQKTFGLVVSVRPVPPFRSLEKRSLSARVRAAMVCTNDDSAHHEETASQFSPAAWARQAAPLRPGVQASPG